MSNIVKDNKRANNGLKVLIEGLKPAGSKNLRFDYANLVIERVKKVNKKEITRNQVYLLVNDYTHIRPDNIFIAKAIKHVVEEFQKDKAELAA